ncbi:type II secretion system F family protein [Longispora albida]|uniref:type II secretion system F family protein n=1 Tax=Longispora albida TaxID=203523 RepID=UPI0003A8E1A6|nr:type II secretion system F family protein [Longispora albida]
MGPLAAILGIGVAAGVLLVVSGLRRPAAPAERGPGLAERLRARGPLPVVRLSVTGAVAVLVGVATGWPVAALLAGVGAWTLPRVLGPDRAGKTRMARMEAIASWSEDLTGTLRAGAGIEQAILTTALIGPPEIRLELDRLAFAIRTGVRLPEALRGFAADLADPTADLVCNVLLQAAQHQARDIAAGLEGVGQAARDQVSARLRIATKRASTQTSTRIVIAVVLGTVLLMSIFVGDFLSPYGTVLGQFVLAVVGACFGGCLMWMVKAGQVTDLPRILTPEPEVTVG